MDLGLTGKKAIVTGGSLGIGKAIARELAREGADVAVVSRTKDVLEAAASEIAKETGRRVIAIPADVSNRAQVDGMVAQAAAQLGGLHILVNSGSPPGGSPSATGPIENLVDEDLLHDFNVKYVGALRCCRAAIPFMKEQKWGRIVNISGLNARNAGNLSGGARNTSLVHLSKTLAVSARPLRHHRELRAPRHHPHRAHAALACRPAPRSWAWTRPRRSAWTTCRTRPGVTPYVA
jgi:NAD(P)-dependent dehydrogenase (short-subunit alcohol dehydrogenase family)